MKKPQALAIFFGGILPLVAFAVIEDRYGTPAGIAAGIVFGLGEIIYEYTTRRKISTITWVSNLMILILGGLSLISAEGIWFKLQPALIEGFFVLFLWGSLIAKKNVMVVLAEKQGQRIPEFLHGKMKGFTFRLGFFFLFHTLLAIWSAFYWTTPQWALLKGVALPVTMIIYVVVEMIIIRWRS